MRLHLKRNKKMADRYGVPIPQQRVKAGIKGVAVWRTDKVEEMVVARGQLLLLNYCDGKRLNIASENKGAVLGGDLF